MELCPLGGAIMQQVAMRISGETPESASSSSTASPPSPQSAQPGGANATPAAAAQVEQPGQPQPPIAGQSTQSQAANSPPAGVGAALVVDYGFGANQIHTCADSWRAFERHEVREALAVEPGTADLTADVDFDFLSRQANVVPGGMWLCLLRS